jgi:hypothetical protein
MCKALMDDACIMLVVALDQRNFSYRDMMSDMWKHDNLHVHLSTCTAIVVDVDGSDLSDVRLI